MQTYRPRSLWSHHPQPYITHEPGGVRYLDVQDAFVHRLDGYQFGEALVCALLGNHGAGNDADYLAARCQCRVRQRAHEADAAAAKADGETATNARDAESCRYSRVFPRCSEA